MGDEYCDDGNNNGACSYDGGDCCPGSNAPEEWDEYCSVCECKEDDGDNGGDSGGDGDGCEYPDYQGDGYCDDGNNNGACSYDGGDCCPGSNPPSGWDSYCSVCECKEDGGGGCGGGDGDN